MNGYPLGDNEVTRADWPPSLQRNPDRLERLTPWDLQHLCTKRCARCLDVKRLSEFHRLASSRDGRHSYCKACRKGGV
jgi:hypothetical protein